MKFKHLEFDRKRMVLRVLDQRALPTRIRWRDVDGAESARDAIKTMVVRGAPLIGVVGAFGLALELSRRDPGPEVARALAERVSSARPTAVNLPRAVSRVLDSYLRGGADEALREAESILEYERESARMIGVHGERLLMDGDVVLTHCNAGALATVEYGTALAPIRVAIEMGKRIRVIADETRPVLQGARLTAFELVKDGIDTTLISDTMVGYAMSKGLVNKVIVGADRVLMDGYVFNKIGTYQVAILARTHHVPFYVAMPLSTLDPTSSPEDVVIEERDPKEVLYVRGRRIAPRGVKVMNPAFDMTPPEYVSAIITERGIAEPPYRESLAELLGQMQQ
ncbi:MAG TPA: S-methyl-5-thioribose-1-phosphate isomerase [Nitrososphaeria archaeon]|jgi:methylthioribose-1-phosphate isomerase|nr:S-methyl-5-thioribose-1-phosphate isomerase [Conexivisphaerales archaeon]HEU16120.1 S-methyl-5-thioribose-1-phosphate isomerase [Nitrososphaeria archaeon]